MKLDLGLIQRQPDQLGPDIAAGLIARELGEWDPGPEAREDDRRFEMAITFDRGRVTAAARSLLNRFPDNTAQTSRVARSGDPALVTSRK